MRNPGYHSYGMVPPGRHDPVGNLPASKENLFWLIFESQRSFEEEDEHRPNDGHPNTIHRSLVAMVRQAPHLCAERNRHGDLPLHDAANYAPLAVVRAIYEAYPPAVGESGWYGHASDEVVNLPLHIACRRSNLYPGKEGVVRFLARVHPQARTVSSRISRRLPLHSLGYGGSLACGSSDELLDALVDGCEETVLLARDAEDKIPLQVFADHERLLLRRRRQQRMNHNHPLRPHRSTTGRNDAAASFSGENFGDGLRRKMLGYARQLRAKNRPQALTDLVKAVCVDPPTMGLFSDALPWLPSHDLGHGQRPLHLVCSLPWFPGQPEVIRDLVAVAPEILTLRDHHGDTPVHRLVKRTAGASLRQQWHQPNQLVVLHYCLSQNEGFVTTRDARGFLPFQLAAVADADLDVVYRLLRESVVRTEREAPSGS